MEPSSRPFGVVVLALLVFVGAGLMGFHSFTALQGLNFSDRQSVFNIFGQIGLAGLGVALGLGLWRCQRWAWWLTVILFTVRLLQSLWQLLSKWDAVSSNERLLTLAAPFLILLYLTQPQVRRAFGFATES